MHSSRGVVNEAGFEVGVTMSPKQAERLGIKPFGDGGAAKEEKAPRPKVYTHGPCAAQQASKFVVQCSGLQTSSVDQRRQMALQALGILRANGFVVLEGLHSCEDVLELEAQAASFLATPRQGFIPQPLRAGRTEGHLPFEAPWDSQWLLRDDIIFEIVANYLQNHLAAGRTQEEQQWGLVQWLTSGAELDWFLAPEWAPKPGSLLDAPPAGCSDVGTDKDLGPFFGRVSVIKTPPGAQAQKHHRDINFPGPGAQLTVQVALTPFTANNGPLAFRPGSHRMRTPGFEAVVCPPPGSITLYDSFTEHRGIENHGLTDRYALYYEFETRGVFSGYAANHFGPDAAAHTAAFRVAVDPELRQWVQRVSM